MKRRTPRMQPVAPERPSPVVWVAVLWPLAVLTAYLAYAARAVAPILLGSP